VFENDVVFLDEHKGSSMEARAAALAKVKALIAPVKAPDAGTISKLQAELKKATAQAAKYKLLAASATKRESIRLHSKLNRSKESFIKAYKHVHSPKGELEAVARRASVAVAAAQANAAKNKALLQVAARKAAYAKAAERTISMLQGKLEASGKATRMVAEKMKKDQHTINKMRNVIATMRKSMKSQAGKVAKAKASKAKAKAKLKAKAAAQKAKHKAKAAALKAKHKGKTKAAKEKTKKAKAKLKHKAAKHKGKAAKHKAKAKESKVKASKAKAAAKKTKKPKSIEKQIKVQKKLMQADYERATQSHKQAAALHAKGRDHKSAKNSINKAHELTKVLTKRTHGTHHQLDTKKKAKKKGKH